MKKKLALSIAVLSIALIVFGIIFGIKNEGKWTLTFSQNIWAILVVASGIALLVISLIMIVMAAARRWGGVAIATGICGVVGFFVPLVGIASFVLALIVLAKK